MIRGEKVYLAPIRMEHAETYRGWINDPEINVWLASGHIPLTANQEKEHLERIDRSDTDEILEIHETDTDELIGLTGLHRIDMVTRDAVMGVAITKEHQGRGLGKDAVVTLLRLAFDRLGLHRVELACFSGNDRALGLYRSLGFNEIGRRRHSVYLRGEFYDSVMFDMLEHEFRERYG
jgi:RimJ/RimL family protein N-acetyltransferase